MELLLPNEAIAYLTYVVEDCLCSETGHAGFFMCCSSRGEALKFNLILDGNMYSC